MFSTALFRHAQKSSLGWAAAFAAVLASIVYFQGRVDALKRAPILEQIDTDTPIVARLMIAGGDPFLASNVATFRAIVANLGTFDAVSVRLLAKLQDDASRLNPAQADNYFVAQGTLPWVGDHFAIANTILARASASRRRDFTPDFFLGVNAWYFEQDFARAGGHFRRAGDKASPPDRDYLLELSANYYDKSDNIAVARAALLELKSALSDPRQKLVIDARLLRLDGLEKLRTAATAFVRKMGRRARTLDEFVAAGIIDAIPYDPIRLGYTIDESGVPRLRVQQAPTYQRKK